MQKRNQLFVALLLFTLLSFRMQTTSLKIAGIYTLTGFREMASGFEFDSLGNFEFMYSYGAVDRMAHGSYLVEGDKVILKSAKEPGKDFAVTKQSIGNNGFTIVVNAPNNYLASYVKALVVNGNEQEEFHSDKNGVIKISLPVAEKIYLQHRLYPDVVTPIKDENNHNNYFEVSLNPSLEQVSFKEIELTIDGDTMHMPPNYFLPYENIRFIRN